MRIRVPNMQVFSLTISVRPLHNNKNIFEVRGNEALEAAAAVNHISPPKYCNLHSHQRHRWSRFSQSQDQILRGLGDSTTFIILGLALKYWLLWINKQKWQKTAVLWWQLRSIVGGLLFLCICISGKGERNLYGGLLLFHKLSSTAGNASWKEMLTMTKKKTTF